MVLNRLSLRRFSAQKVRKDDSFHMVLVSYLWLLTTPGTSLEQVRIKILEKELHTPGTGLYEGPFNSS